MRLSILRDVVNGMRFLHDVKPRPVLHTDLKAANVLVDLKLRAKVTDFGLTESKGSAGGPSGSVAAGADFWTAPEVLCGQPASRASDGASNRRPSSAAKSRRAMSAWRPGGWWWRRLTTPPLLCSLLPSVLLRYAGLRARDAADAL